MGVRLPVLKLREQGFKAILDVFVSLVGFESAKVAGDYGMDLEFFYLYIVY